MTDLTATALISAVFGLAAAIVSALALRSGKRKESEQDSAATAVTAMSSMLSTLTSELARQRAKEGELERENDSLRRDLRDMGRREADQQPPAN